MDFAQEDWDAIKVEADDLFLEHQQEVGFYNDVQVLSVDHALYDAVNKRGRIRFYSARENGVLVGYAMFILGYSGHYKDSLRATNDCLYIESEHRKGLAGYKFMQWCETQLSADPAKIKFIIWKTKTNHDFGPILKRQGYALEELTYSKHIGAVK